jgi:hypothetical protein
MIPKVALFVVSWASLERVRQGSMLTMAKEVDQHYFTMFSVLAMNRTYGIAVTAVGML